VKKLRILIVGAGDVAQRLATSSVRSRAKWFGLARSEASQVSLRSLAIVPIEGDLDHRKTLARAAAIARHAHATLYLAPPPNLGSDDPRMKRWVAACANQSSLRRRQRSRAQKRATPGTSAAKYSPKMHRLPRRLRSVYVSTTGVYGDRAGEWVDENTRVRAGSARAKRRVAAETRIRRSRQMPMTILRAPGIYAETRLPIERLREKVPALIASEDVYTNHIHADDLAHAAWLSMFRAKPKRVYNIVDDASLRMGEYFDAVAHALGLPKPPRMPRAELAKHVTPMMLSFMSESRRIQNTRMKRELRLRLRYATPNDLLATMKPETALQRALL
jgi:hypothetical protein